MSRLNATPADIQKHLTLQARVTDGDGGRIGGVPSASQRRVVGANVHQSLAYIVNI
jgi:hypothetical protein